MAGPFSPEEGLVAIRDKDGSVWKIPEAQLGKAQAEGAIPATEAEWHSAKLGTAGQVGSTVIGAARGVSLGYSDPLYVEGARALGGDHSADDVRRVLNLAKEMHPDATTGGEVAGMALPMFFGGGAASAARGGIASRALAAAPRAFAEGAVIGAGQQSSEDALGDHKFVAEKYATSMAKGGAVGLILGTGLHAAAGALRGKPATFGAGLSPNSVSQAETEALGIERAATSRVEDQVNAQYKPIIDAHAGLANEAAAVERPISIDPTKRYRVGLDTNALEGEFASVPAGQEPISKIRVATEGAGFGVPEAGKPFSFAEAPGHGASYETLRNRVEYGGGKGAAAARKLEAQPQRALSRQEEPFDVWGPNEGFAEPTNIPKWIPTMEAPIEQRFGLRDRGLAGLGEQIAERPVIGRSAGKTAPRDVFFNPVEAGSIEAGPGPISFAQAPEEAAARATVNAERDAGSTMGIVDQSIQNMSPLERIAYERQYAATGARMGDIRKLGATAEAQDLARARIGKTLTEQVPSGPFTTVGDYAKAISEKAREIGKTFRPIMSELDKAAARPSMRAIEQAFDTDVRQIVGKGLYGDEQLAQAEGALERFVDKGGADPSFTKLYDLRRDLDKKLETHFARVAGAPAPPGEAAMRQLRDIVQLEIMSAAERASLELNKPLADTLKLNNVIYKDLAAARSAASKEASRAAGAPAYSASDMMSVVAAMASGSPLGAAIPVANVIRKKFGNQIAAYALRKATGLENLATVSSRVDAELSKGAKAVVEGNGTSRGLKTFTQDEIRDIRNAALNPASVQSKIADAIHGMSDYAPKIAAEVATSVARVASYLALALPKDQPPMGPIFTTKNTDRIFSDTEIRKASAAIEVAQDPSIVLDRMRDGLLANDHVKALKAMHPQTFYKIQNFLMEHATELRPEMSIQQQVTMSILFQKPIAKVMERSNITALQASFTGGDQAPSKNGAGFPVSQMAGSVPKMAAGPIKGGGIRATTFDLAEKGDRR